MHCRKIKAEMLFDQGDDDYQISKGRTLRHFHKSADDPNVYEVKVKNFAQFQLCIKYVSLGASFRLTS
jgi:hypothetical protein